MREAEIGDTI